MGRSRISRGLVFILLVVIVIAAVVVWYRHGDDAAPEAVISEPVAEPVVSSTPEPLPGVAVASVVELPPVEAAPSVAPSEAVPPASQPVPSSSVLEKARARFQSDDLLEARRLLNEAMADGTLGEADLDSAKKLLDQINRTVIFSSRRFADDQTVGSYTVKSGDRLASIASSYDVTWELLGRLNGINDPRKLRAGATLKVVNGPFHALVSKKRYVMEVYLGSPGERGAMYVCSFPVGLGADDSTPLGSWIVEPHKKLRNPTYYSPRGQGIIQADDPKNPLGEFWIGLAGTGGEAVGKVSYGIHGTIEPDSIGRQASMGCIRMHNEDVALVYDLLVEGKSTVRVEP